MIDFHCHLDLYPEPNRVAEKCAELGMYILSVTTTPSAWRGTSELARDRIRTALGLHPQCAHERKIELGLFDELLPQARYVGEIGLDGAPEFRPHFADQIAVFEHILASGARMGGRGMSIHSRRATGAVLDCLEAQRTSGVPVLHWFSGSMKDLERAILLGCWFSVGPAMLKTAKGKDLARHMPFHRVLPESDGPFVQLDGQPILPWQVDVVSEELCGLWGIEREQMDQLLLSNLRALVQAA